MVISHHHPPFHIHHGNHGKMVGWSDSFQTANAFFSTLKKKPWVFWWMEIGKVISNHFPMVKILKDPTETVGYHPKASRNDACAFSTKRWWHVHQHQQEGIKLAQEFHSCKKKLEGIKELQCLTVVIQLVLLLYGKSNHWMCLNDRTEIDFLSSHSHGVSCCQGQHE